MKGHILILGYGFIGQALATNLAASGCTVTVISRNAPEHFIDGINWQQGDINDAILIYNYLKQCETVFYLASTSTPGSFINKPTHEATENLLPLLHLVEILKNAPDTNLVYLSSGGAIYGNPNSQPVSETHILSPLSYHAAGKAAAEHFLGVFAHQGYPVTILRPSNVYGPQQQLKTNFAIIRTLLEHIKHDTYMTIWGDGNIVRDYLYIDDLISACIAVLKSPTTGTFNVGSGQGHSITDLCRLAEKITGMNLKLRHEPNRNIDVKAVVLNNSSFRHHYPWETEFTIEQGILHTWEWLHNL